MKLILFIVLGMAANNAYTQYLMPKSGSASYTTCGVDFYDAGGASASYPVNQNTSVTFHPLNSTDKLSVKFNSFQSWLGDTLYVYNGNSTSAPLIGKLNGAAGYGTITSTASDGTLTFKFVSDGQQNASSEAGWNATITCNTTPPDITMIASGTFTTCSGNFYDGGGPNGSYMGKQNTVTTLKPATAGSKISVSFSSFQSWLGDTLYIYNGNSTSAPLIGKLNGAAGYGTITSAATDGTLTFKFVSDGQQNAPSEAGWKATIACNAAPTDITMLASGTFATCSGNFYDGGGPTGSYMGNQNAVTTLKPSTASGKISVTFNSFQSWLGDTLYVYNGNSTSAPLIGKLNGAAGYGTITSTATDGTLTFKFVSDGQQNAPSEAGWSATIACNAAPTDITMLASGTFTTCSGNFYDGGGPTGSYMGNQNTVTTLKPSTASGKISVTFNSFQSWLGDTLYVYNGNSTSAPLIGKLNGGAGYGTITSTASDGTLTFKFVSDGQQNAPSEAGWSATIACNAAPTDITMIASGTFATCSGNFYDGGGPNGSYMGKQNTVTTLKPSTAAAKLSVTFNSFQSWMGDTLYIYNGNSTSAPLIGKLNGAAGYGTVTSSAADGTLTFKFVSDGQQNAPSEAGWKATIACNLSPADITMIASGTFTTCSGNFYDGGGPNGSYMGNQNTVTTVKPLNGGKISVAFSSFQSWLGDTLYVYNGSSTSSPLIKKITGTTNPGTISSSSTDGNLTFKFISNASQNAPSEAGWKAVISCSGNTAIISIDATATQIPPWQRAADAFSGHINVKNSEATLWHLEVDVHDGNGNYLFPLIYPSTTNLVQNFNRQSDASLAAAAVPGRQLRYYAVMDAGNQAFYAGAQNIIDSQWINKTLVYFNKGDGTGELKIPVKYTAGFDYSQVSLNFDRPGGYSTESGSLAGSCIPMSNDGYIHVNSSNSNLNTVAPGVFNFTIYSRLCSVNAIESSAFELSKIGKLGNSSSNKIVIFIAGFRNTIESDFLNLRNNLAATASATSEAPFSLASYLNANGLNCWYIAQPNLQDARFAAYDIAVAIDSIYHMNDRAYHNGNYDIGLVAHSLGGLEIRSVLEATADNHASLIYSLDQSRYYTFSYLNTRLTTGAFPASINRVLFLDVPHRGAQLASTFSWLITSPAGKNLMPGNSYLNALNSSLLPQNLHYANLSGYTDDTHLDDGAVQLTESEHIPSIRVLPSVGSAYWNQIYQRDYRGYSTFWSKDPNLWLHVYVHMSNMLQKNFGNCTNPSSNLSKIQSFLNGAYSSQGCKRLSNNTYAVSVLSGARMSGEPQLASVSSENPFQLTIAPNPFGDECRVIINGVINKQITIVVSDILGQQIYTCHQMTAANDFSKTIDLGSRGSGVYFVRVTIDGKDYLRKVIKLN